MRKLKLRLRSTIPFDTCKGHISVKTRTKKPWVQRTYIQFFIVVVEEDKLRVGAGDVFHHQVVAEKVTAVKDKGDTCQAKRCVWKQRRLGVEGYYRGMSSTTKALTCRQRTRSMLYSHVVVFLNGGFSETRNVKHCVLQAQRGSGSSRPLTPGPFECRRFDSISHLWQIIREGTEYVN